jgi:membrane protein DedA with SNARE-associated domain
MSHLIVTYGYLAVALLVGAESVGIPVPGETALILAAGYAGHTHQLSAWIIFAAAAAAAILGDNVGFWIGGRGGYRLLRKYGHNVRMDETKLKIGALTSARARSAGPSARWPGPWPLLRAAAPRLHRG